MDRGHLGDSIRRRRVALGLSVSRAAREAGINRATWTALEDGSRDTLTYNYGPIERVLGWAGGSIDRVLAGGEPELADTPAVATPNTSAKETLRLIAAIARSKMSDSTVRKAVDELLDLYEQGLAAELKRDAPPEPGQRLGAC